jgi:hypothetical protein
MVPGGMLSLQCLQISLRVVTIAMLSDLERLLDGEEETRRVTVERRMVLGMLPQFSPCVLEFEIGGVRNGSLCEYATFDTYSATNGGSALVFQQK